MKKDSKPIVRNVIVAAVVLASIIGLLSLYSFKTDAPREATLSEVVSEVTAGNVHAIVVRGNDIEVTLKDGGRRVADKEPGQSMLSVFDDYEVPAEQRQTFSLTIEEPSGWGSALARFATFAVPLIVIALLFFLMMRQVQGGNNRAMSFGKSGARETPKDAKDRLTFADVAGNKEAKIELLEIVEFLRDPKKFSDIGAKIPKGALLMGSPGTGKTLMSRAVAGEANVPFFHISGSEFVEMFVGVGASRVRDLFSEAKKQAPCIVFVDEIDAVGRQRGSGLGGSHDEREQTLNQILVEMDGFEPNQGVIVLAATNRPDVLDPALLRPGRFDRRIVLDEPDINDREAILKIHAKNKPLAKDIDLRRVAQRTPGFSGADLANVLNEAAILAAREDKKLVDQRHVLESIEKVMLGPERKSYILSEAEKKVTAYHEGGHALVAHLLPDADDVHKVSIVSRGTAAGYTLKLPDEDKRMHRKKEFLADLAVSLGGYVAETDIFGKDNLTTGASSDLRKATNLARRLVTDYGMSEILGPRTYGEKDEMIFLGKEVHHQRDYSEKVAETIDAEVSRLLTEAMATARQILTDNRAKLDKIASELLEKETIEKEAFEKLLA
jgi:cell division protease FtsH